MTNFVEYPLGHGQVVQVPHQSFPPSFSQFTDMTAPYRLELAGIGYLDLPSGIDIWTRDGYVPISNMSGNYMEFLPQFTLWTLQNGNYSSVPVSYAQITRAKVISATLLTGTQLSALPIYSGSFIQLVPGYRSTVTITVDSTLQPAGNGVPLGLSVVTDVSLVPKNIYDQKYWSWSWGRYDHDYDPDNYSPNYGPGDTPLMVPLVAPPTYHGPIISSGDLLVSELEQALSLGVIGQVLYDGNGNPTQVTGTYVNNPYQVVYTYALENGIQQISYETATYLTYTFVKTMTFDTNGLFIGSSSWIRQ